MIGIIVPYNGLDTTQEIRLGNIQPIGSPSIFKIKKRQAGNGPERVKIAHGQNYRLLSSLVWLGSRLVYFKLN